MTDSVHTLLSKIQKELKAPKGQYNSFGKYSYRSCEDIVESIKPLIGEGCLIVSDEIVLIGQRYYVKATARLSFNGESIEAVGYAREPEDRKGMDSAQVTGASSSYARKYCLNGLFAIDDTKDPDATNTHEKDHAKPTERPTAQQKGPHIKTASDNQVKLAMFLRDRTGAKVSDEKIKSMSVQEMSVFIGKLSAKKKELDALEPRVDTGDIPW